MTAENYPSIPTAPISTSDRALIILCHLSAFVGAPFVLPFIVWLVKKNEPDTVSAHAAEALNFHLSLLLYILMCIPLAIVVIGIPLILCIALASAVLAVVAALRASDGLFYRYPLTIRLVK